MREICREWDAQITNFRFYDMPVGSARLLRSAAIRCFRESAEADWRCDDEGFLR